MLLSMVCKYVYFEFTFAHRFWYLLHEMCFRNTKKLWIRKSAKPKSSFGRTKVTATSKLAIALLGVTKWQSIMVCKDQTFGRKLIQNTEHDELILLLNVRYFTVGFLFLTSKITKIYIFAFVCFFPSYFRTIIRSTTSTPDFHLQGRHKYHSECKSFKKSSISCWELPSGFLASAMVL